MAKEDLASLVAVDMDNGFTYIGLNSSSGVCDAVLRNYIVVPTSRLANEHGGYEEMALAFYNSWKRSERHVYL